MDGRILMFFEVAPREKICYFWKKKFLQTRWSAYLVCCTCYDNDWGWMFDGSGRRLLFSKVTNFFSEWGWIWFGYMLKIFYGNSFGLGNYVFSNISCFKYS